jgi:hypothetical protein
MKAAIATLEAALSTLEINEPINRNEGMTEQADLEAKSAADIRQALVVLKALTESTKTQARHRHVNNGVDDGCRECGNDLRDDIHFRVGEL